VAAECVHPVLEADQAGAAGEVRATVAVVADGEAQEMVCGVGFDGDLDA
jgi:hypothetical protein